MSFEEPTITDSENLPNSYSPSEIRIRANLFDNFLCLRREFIKFGLIIIFIIYSLTIILIHFEKNGFFLSFLNSFNFNLFSIVFSTENERNLFLNNSYSCFSYIGEKKIEMSYDITSNGLIFLKL